MADVQDGLPPVYSKIGQARASGFTWDEINQAYGARRAEAKAQGYSDTEINGALGLPADYGQPSQQDTFTPTMPFGEGADEAASTVRAFSKKYLTPSFPEHQPGAPRTVGKMFRDSGILLEDVGKIFGGAIVNGYASILEMMDGKQRTPEEWSKLNAEAMNVTGLIAGGPKFAGREMPFGLPKTQDVIDAAAAITKPGDDITPAAQALGQHFLKTGEHPLDAAQRVQQDAGTSGEYSVTTEGVGTQTHSSSGNGVFSRQKLEGGKTTHAVLNEEGDFVSPLEIDRTREASDPAHRAWMGTPEGRDLAARLSSFADDIRNPEAAATEARGIVKRLVTGEITQEEAEAASQRLLGSATGRANNLGLAVLKSLSREETGSMFPERPGYTAYNPVTGEGAEITPTSITQARPGLATKLSDSWKRLYNPADRTEESRLAGQIIIEGMAKENLANALAAQDLRQFGRAVADLTPEQSASFIHAMETGDVSGYAPDSPLGKLAPLLKDRNDALWDKLHERGLIDNYVENYVPHMYADPEAAAEALPRHFTKERIFSSYLEAAQELGLKPKTVNPLELQLIHEAQANRLLNYHDIVQQFKDTGIIRQRPYKMTLAESMKYRDLEEVPSGFLRPNGNGTWVTSEPVAHVLKRWLAPSELRGPIFDMARSSGNMMNMAQLTLNGYHAKYMFFAGGLSHAALGVKQMLRLTPEEIARGTTAIAKSPVASVWQYKLGSKLIQQVMQQKDFGPQIRALAEGWITGGGRVRMDKFYDTSAAGSFWENMKGSLIAQNEKFVQGDGMGPMTLEQAIIDLYRNAESSTLMPRAVRATAMLVPRIFSTIMHPIFQHLVPRLKMGAFAEQLADELRLNPNMSPEQFRATAQRIMHQIDNLEGEKVVDNQFWGKTALDAGNLVTRALTWTVGHMETLGGGAADLLKGRNISSGDMRTISERAATVVALPIFASMVGLYYGLFMGTWSPDWTLKDYLFPKNGGKDAQGGDERVNLVGLAQDAFEWGHQPYETAINKTHPQISAIWDMLNNTDFYGGAITDPNAPIWQRGEDYANYYIKQYVPFNLEEQPGQENSDLGWFARSMGFRPAPYFIREPGREEGWYERELRKRLKKKALEDNE